MPGRLIIVTGLSGAGRSTALKSLEDAGYDAIDNLPFHLLRQLVRPGEPLIAPLALGIDSRSRGLVPGELVQRLQELRGAVDVTLLFMECDDEVLARRFSENRRRHPMAADRPVGDGVARERRLLAPLHAAADLVFDSTKTSAADLRRWMQERFAAATGQGLAISLISFAFRQGLPREADLVFDIRFVRNPHYIDALRALTGQDPAVQAYIDEDEDFRPAIERFDALVAPLLPRYAAEGKSYLTVAIGCTGGQHRSVYAVELLSRRLRAQGRQITVIHRDMLRRGHR